MTTPDEKQRLLVKQIRQIAVDKLDISDYSRTALRRVVSAAAFYMDIYRSSLEHVLACGNKAPIEMTLVDYGGGHGLLSILAKKLGFGRVVYVDYNADALQTVGVLGGMLGAEPDVVLQGDATVLEAWCRNNGVTPDALLAMDVIEHIYVLDDFFAVLHAMSPKMTMLFTTASTPFNQRVVRRLHKTMLRDEYGGANKEGFLSMRRGYVKQMHPDMSDRELDYWAENTRGLVFDDVRRAVESQSPNLLLDAYNTCDPRSGSWTERILPISDYQQLLAAYGYGLLVLPGFYNEYRRGPKEWASRHYNRIIRRAPQQAPEGWRQRRRMKRALSKAPFIFLIANPE